MKQQTGSEARQMQLAKCEAPCWPICCPDCPFGDLGTTLEQFEELLAASPQEE